MLIPSSCSTNRSLNDGRTAECHGTVLHLDLFMFFFPVSISSVLHWGSKVRRASKEWRLDGLLSDEDKY